MKTALIDYGAGNLHSVHKALLVAGFDVVLTADPAVAADAAVLVLPGQGHFRQVMEAFLSSGFEPVVRAHLAARKPFLGICVGLQLLMQASEEAPGVPGLGVLQGEVKRFPAGVSVPQMGWNQLSPHGRPPLLNGVPDGAFVYFANSYYVEFTTDLPDATTGGLPDATTGGLPGATTEYGGVTFESAVCDGPLNAVQFHPEKSQKVGLRVLKNFYQSVQDSVQDGVQAPLEAHK
ncbi:imidazole glycerol phosphate synthase subunit HisH [soil metagenome]